ncbi:MAG: hypothetical protein IKO52_06520 [Clostridia bacterium]|nr:hypothetical protein [Clostridia bacterium]
MKQVAILTLVLCLLVGMCVPASAAVIIPDGTFSSDYFISYGCIIGDIGGHMLNITFTCTGMGVCDEIGVANYTVQKQYTLDDGTKIWANVAGPLAGVTRTNAAFCTYGVNFQGIAGERYRVIATFVCTKTINGVVGTETKFVTTTGCTVN